LIKLVKSLFKLAEGLLVIFLPLVIFYWTLSLIDIDIIKPITAIAGAVIEPLMIPFKSFIKYRVKYNNVNVDYSVLIFAGMIVLSAYVLNICGHILTYMEKIAEKIKNKIKEQEQLIIKAQEKKEYVKELNKNKTIYVALKLIKQEPKEAYLIQNEGDDLFSVGLVDSYENSIINICTKFSAKIFGNVGGAKNVHGFIFDDVDKFLEYLPFLKDRIEEINSGMLDLNVKFDYKAACHCSYSDVSSDVDFEILNRIINLCGIGEIYLSELLKRRLDVMDTIKGFNFFSRGVYLIKDKQVDLFRLQFEKSEE